jgi:Prokaryotic phospholipase A2
MVIRARLVVAVATTLTALSALMVPAHTASAAGPDRTVDLATIVHLEVAPMAEFQRARVGAQPPWLDWTNDGCSTPSPIGLGDTGRSFNFRMACQRHDFGYRNTKLYDQRFGTHEWNAASRQRIDSTLLRDMRADCAPRPFTQRFNCRAWADIYYRAVRLAGGP